MKHAHLIWIAFAACLTVVLAAMAWMSLTALRLDRAESAAKRSAAREENVQLALWRIDSALAPLVARESATPPSLYRRFLLQRSVSSIRSPLSTDGPPHVLLHFQFAPDGRLTSPQVPEATKYKTRLASLTDSRRLADMLPEPSRVATTPNLAATPPTSEMGMMMPGGDQVAGRPRSRGAEEFSRRAMAVQNTNVMSQTQARGLMGGQQSLALDVADSLMTPLWIEGNLLLARRVRLAGKEHVQGCLLDWPALKRWLLATIEDLLPEADLLPVATTPSADQTRMIAALPVRLKPGGGLPAPDGSASPIRFSLAVAWTCVLLAAVAVGLLLLGVMRLSERRAAFVSAVTHELRTPLTTFQMYAEMLAEGMVPDPQRQHHYLETLRREAARLTHLVENVLSYARVERQSGPRRLEELPLDELVEQASGRLVQRAAAAGMELIVELDESVRSATVRANPSAVEQILFNLVDNASKYAAEAADRRIHLTAKRGNRDTILLAVRDHGPGISRAEGRRLFRPFSKSSRQAADSAPGVGLGLALSRHLARAMKGDLRLETAASDGACFLLTLAARGEAAGEG